MTFGPKPSITHPILNICMQIHLLKLLETMMTFYSTPIINIVFSQSHTRVMWWQTFSCAPLPSSSEMCSTSLLIFQKVFIRASRYSTISCSSTIIFRWLFPCSWKNIHPIWKIDVWNHPWWCQPRSLPRIWRNIPTPSAFRPSIPHRSPRIKWKLCGN